MISGKTDAASAETADAASVFCNGDEPKAGRARDLGGRLQSGMCLWALPVIDLSGNLP